MSETQEKAPIVWLTAIDHSHCQPMSVALLCTISTQIGLLATVGVSEAPVIPCPRVGVMSTGDELVEPGEPISGGFIRDSNR